MKVKGEIPARGSSFEELLDLIKSRAYRELFPRILATAYHLRFLTDGAVMTRLDIDERIEIDRIHSSALRTVEGYNDARVLDILETTPRFLGPSVEEAIYAGRGKKYDLVLLRSTGRELLVEARGFMTLLRRHPNSDWRFAKGRNYKTKPVLLLSQSGMRAGEVEGAITPLRIELGSNASLYSPSDDWLELQENEMRYAVPCHK